MDICCQSFLTSGRSVTLNTSPVPPPSGNQDDNPLFEDEDNNSSSVSTEPNNYRLTPYSRLDLGISYRKIRNAKKRKWESEWKLAVYNVYAHENTYFAYRSIDPTGFDYPGLFYSCNSQSDIQSEILIQK
ncbi:MAG TPA: hypothetical protein VF487_13295 [Chitinophagaceae bacterium]